MILTDIDGNYKYSDKNTHSTSDIKMFEKFEEEFADYICIYQNYRNIKSCQSRSRFSLSGRVEFSFSLNFPRTGNIFELASVFFSPILFSSRCSTQLSVRLRCRRSGRPIPCGGAMRAAPRGEKRSIRATNEQTSDTQPTFFLYLSPFLSRRNTARALSPSLSFPLHLYAAREVYNSGILIHYIREHRRVATYARQALRDRQLSALLEILYRNFFFNYGISFICTFKSSHNNSKISEFKLY